MSELGGIWHGSTGKSLDEVIGVINGFTSNNPGDVIVLHSRHLHSMHDQGNNLGRP